MKFTTSFLAAATLSVLASSLPLEPRDTCSYIFQPTIYWISQHQSSDPATPQPSININQQIGFVDTIASFSGIPSSAYGCTLEYNFKPSSNALVYGTGNPQVINVFALPETLPSPITWDSLGPVTGSLVGTWQFPTGAALNSPQKIFINSFACTPTMNFRFEVADTWSVYGGISDVDTASSGLSIAYNC